MGRPDLTETRTAEILDAFERCVGRYGLEGSSLECIAEEAGMKRSILRHYIGNRDDLVLALCERVVEKYRADLEAHMQAISPTNRIEQLIGILLPVRARESRESIVVIESLIAAAEEYPQVQEQMTSYVDYVVAVIAEQLSSEFPSRSKQECWQVAYGVVCIWFNQESLMPLQLPRRYVQAARESLRHLINTLAV